MDTIHAIGAFFAAHPAAQGALAGFTSAAHIDFVAFKSWQSFHEAASYGWSKAAWRWLQGAVNGCIVGAGLGAMVG